jgi:hypothetical protein
VPGGSGDGGRDDEPTAAVAVPTSTGAVLAATGAGWTIPPGTVGGPDPAGDVAELAELVRHLVGVTPLPSGLVLVLLRCADDDPAMRPTLDDLDRALAACLLVLDEDGTAPPVGPGPLPRPARLVDVPVGSVLERPRVLRPEGARSRRRVASRAHRRLALLAAAIVSALVLGRAVVAPALADVAAAPERLTPTAAPTTAPTTAPMVTSTPVATTVPVPEGSVGSGGADPSDPEPVGDPAPGSPGPRTSSRPGAPEPLPTTTATTMIPSSAPTIAGRTPREPAPASEPTPRGAGSPPTAGPTAPLPAAVDWVVALTRLDGVRHAALVAGSREALARAVDPRGPAWAADAALADRIRTLGARLVGGEVSVVSADLVSLDGRGARLIVVDARAAYAVTLDGSTARVPARGVTTWDVRLTRAADGAWRIHDVRAPT